MHSNIRNIRKDKTNDNVKIIKGNGYSIIKNQSFKWSSVVKLTHFQSLNVFHTSLPTIFLFNYPIVIFTPISIKYKRIATSIPSCLTLNIN